MKWTTNKLVRLTPSDSSMISFPIEAKVVHLQLLIAFAAHLLCTLHLQTSQLSPWLVTPLSASLQTLQYVGRAWEVAYLKFKKKNTNKTYYKELIQNKIKVIVVL